MQQIHTNEHDDIISLTFTASESRVLVDKRSSTRPSQEEEWEVVDADGQQYDGEEQQKEQEVTVVVSPNEQMVGEEHQQDVASGRHAASSFVFVPSSLEVQQSKNRSPSQETSTAVEQNESTNQDQESTGNTDDDGKNLRADASYQLFQEEQRARHNVLIEEKRLFQFAFATCNSDGDSRSLFQQELYQLQVRMQIALDEALAKDMEQKAADRYTAAKEIALVDSETSKHPKMSQQNQQDRNGQQQHNERNKISRLTTTKAVAIDAPPTAVEGSKTINRPCDCLGATSGMHRPSCQHQGQKSTLLDKLFA